MGRKPCCQKEGLNKGAWTAMEDKILTDYISLNGEGKWRDLPIYAGLQRCGKSCRLRWLNYLKPDIKRGNITPDEEDLIIRLHKLLGNRWSLIAGRLPGRTDNEIKNYWNTKLGKRVQGDGTINRLQFHDHQNKHRPSPSSSYRHDHHLQPVRPTCVVYTRATRCTKVVISKELENIQVKKDVGDTAKNPIETTLNSIGTNEASTSLLSPQGVLEQGPMPALDEFQSLDLKIDMDINDHVLSFFDLEYHHPQQTGREVMMSSPLANDYLFMNEVIHGELDADWITSFIQSELSKQSY